MKTISLQSVPTSDSRLNHGLNLLLLLFLTSIWLSQDLLTSFAKPLRLVVDAVQVTAGLIFFFQFRSRRAPQTQLLFVFSFIFLHLYLFTTIPAAIETITPKHILFGYRGTLITLYSYFFGYLVFSQFGEKNVFRTLSVLLVINFFYQLAQAAVSFGADNQFGIFGPTTCNMTGFILNLMLLVISTRIVSRSTILLISILVISSLLCFAQASLALLIMVLAWEFFSSYVLQPRYYLNKKYIAIVASVLLLVTGYIITYPLYNDSTLWVRLNDGLFGDYSGGYLSGQGMVVMHAQSVFQIYHQPQVNIWLGTGPSTWGSKGAGLINGRFNQQFLPVWRLSGTTFINTVNMSYSALATILVECGLLGTVFFLLLHLVIPIVHWWQLGRQHQVSLQEKARITGFRRALAYQIISLPYLLIFTQYNQIFICSFFMAWLGYLDYRRIHPF